MSRQTLRESCGHAEEPTLVDAYVQIQKLTKALEGLEALLGTQEGNGLKPDYLGEVLGTFSLRANFCTKTLASAIEAHYGQMI